MKKIIAILLLTAACFGAFASESKQSIFTLPLVTNVYGSNWIVLGTERGKTNSEKNVQVQGLLDLSHSDASNTVYGSKQPQVIIFGDSMTERNGIPGWNGWVYQLTTNANWPQSVGIINMAKSGDTVSQDLANWDTRYKPIFEGITPSTNNWVIIWKGYNDGDTTTYYTNLTILMARIRQYVPNILLCTHICNSTNNNLPIVNAINEKITNGYFNADITLDLQALSFASWTNFWYSDSDKSRVHPTEYLCSKIASLITSNLAPRILQRPVLGPGFYGGFNVYQTWNSNAQCVIDANLIMKNSNPVAWRDPSNPLLVANFIKPVTWWGNGLGIYTYGIARITLPADLYYGRDVNGTNAFNDILGYTLIKGGLAVTNGLEVGGGSISLTLPQTAPTNTTTPSAWAPITLNGTNFWMPVYK